MTRIPSALKYGGTALLCALIIDSTAGIVHPHPVTAKDLARNSGLPPTVSLQVLDNDFVELYFPSLGSHNPQAGLAPSDKVSNFIPNQIVNPDSRGAKPDDKGLIRIPAAHKPYYKLDRLQLYIEPGDQLSVDLKAKRYPWDVPFYGRNAAANRWLNQELLYPYSPMLRHNTRFDTALSYNDYRRTIFDNAAFVKRQLDSLQTTAAFKKDGQLRVDFTTISALLNYWQFMQMNKTVRNAPITAAQHDSILHDITALLPHPYHKTYNDLPESVNALQALSQFDSAYITQEKFPGFGELHQLIASLSSHGDNDLLYSGKLSPLVAQTQDPALKEILMKWQHSYGHLQKGEKAPDLLLRDKDDKTYKLSDFTGKILYVDCWATWCNPCIALKPAFEALAENHSGDDIVFISISKDKNVGRWKQWLTTHKQSAHVKEFIVADDEAMTTLYQMQFIPRLLLIDKQFRFITALAPRPGESRLTDLLPELKPSVTLTIKDNSYPPYAYPSLTARYPASGLRPSSRVTNFIEPVAADGVGAKPDQLGRIKIAAANEPYYKLEGLQLYIEPGDSLTVDLKNKPAPGQALFEGNHATANQWLNESLFLDYRMLSLQTDNFLDTSLSYTDYKKRLYRKLDSLSLALDALDAPQKFIKDGHTRLHFLAISALVNYMAYNSYFKYAIRIRPDTNDLAERARIGTQLRAFYKEKHDSILHDINLELPSAFDDEDMQLPEVTAALEHLSVFDQRWFEAKHFHQFDEMHHMLSVMNERGHDDFFFSDKIGKLADSTKEEDLKEEIKKWQSRYGSLQPGQPVIDIALEDTAGHTILLSSLKGKVLYVDVWATWCGPCLALKPFFEKLAAGRNGQMNFISISDDQDKSRWKEYIRTHTCPPGVQQYVIKDEHSFAQQYQLQFIPRFFLITPGYTYITALASTPDNPDMGNMLDQIIRNQ